MEPFGSGNKPRNTFRAPFRLWTSTMLRSMSGKSLVPFMGHRPRPQSFGPKGPAICLCTATLKNWSRPSLLCPPLPQILERVAVYRRKPSTTLPLMPSGCVIRRFEHRGCMWAGGSLKRLVKPLWLLASSARVCAGLLAAWMLFCLCALAFSTAPTTTSGRANLVWLLRHPQLISTHLSLAPLASSLATTGAGPDLHGGLLPLAH